eukprot:CAMPEP_0113654464 /NCGR_PEP_ID=MMETSP0017_2-20120614/29169_1 /TAXON_ID=2856 /ORGANISM="Cylindrotheca closterium" /LENGTH=237 /DNA_ID=CAMNT_0000567611 /DNA_START=11 /DNA_END=721 /DNA_ORIENTATION=- /assembly_acc=CAM_ASM_000147
MAGAIWTFGTGGMESSSSSDDDDDLSGRFALVAPAVATEASFAEESKNETVLIQDATLMVPKQHLGQPTQRAEPVEVKELHVTTASSLPPAPPTTTDQAKADYYNKLFPFISPDTARYSGRKSHQEPDKEESKQDEPNTKESLELEDLMNMCPTESSTTIDDDNNASSSSGAIWTFAAGAVESSDDDDDDLSGRFAPVAPAATESSDDDDDLSGSFALKARVSAPFGVKALHPNTAP